jgi:serine/threonine-protein kinase RsbW
MGRPPNPLLLVEKTSTTYRLDRTSASETFTGADIGKVRALVHAAGVAARVASDELDNLLLAVSEVVTNAIVHGGDAGSVAVEHQTTGLVVVICDNGNGLPDNLPSDRPSIGAIGGRGLWLAHVMCPHIEIISSQGGVTVRLNTSGRTTDVIS